MPADHSTNGTRLNGQLVFDTVRLENGAEIGIGDIRLRFTLDGADRPTLPLPALPLPQEGPNENGDTSTTLQADELSTLVRFLNDSLKETTPRSLLRLALDVVHRQTRADLCGFLSLEADDPLPRVVVPEEGKVDVQLSKHLTSEVLRKGRAIWLGEGRESAAESDSLAHFADAICVPLLGTQGPLADRRPWAPFTFTSTTGPLTCSNCASVKPWPARWPKLSTPSVHVAPWKLTCPGCATVPPPRARN